MKKENKRTCIVSRQPASKDELIRFVVGPEDKVVADLRMKLPGRGIWVTNNRMKVQQALSRKLFASGFGVQALADENLLRDIEDQMLMGIIRGLSIAKKSGLVLTGFSKVEALARRGDIKIVFQASDGTSDGKGKIKSALIAGQLAGSYKKGLPQPIRHFASHELDKALGQYNSVHVGLISGGATTSLKMLVKRLNDYGNQPPG